MHEVTVTPEDLDNDTLLNFQDTDSDGDLLPNGIDPMPYEGSINQRPNAGSPDFELIQPGGDRRTIQIADSNGPTDALNHLINTLGQVTLRSEPDWPEAVLEDSDLDSRWIAFGIGSGPAAPCPEWRISRDVSAIRSNLTAPALPSFERYDDKPFMASLAVGVAADLDSLDDAQNSIQGRGAWNDALRMIVSDNTVGWMEINTDGEFAGTGCQLNLSSFIYGN